LASREGVQLLESTALPIRLHRFLYGLKQNAASLKAFPALPKLYEILRTPVSQQQSPSKYLLMASLGQAEVKELQMLHALRSRIIGNYDNSVHTHSPVFTRPSNSTVYPEVPTSSPILEVQPMRYHNAPISIVNTTDLSQEHNTALDTTPIHPVAYILLW
jgi:hypothetical protein